LPTLEVVHGTRDGVRLPLSTLIWDTVCWDREQVPGRISSWTDSLSPPVLAPRRAMMDFNMEPIELVVILVAVEEEEGDVRALAFGRLKHRRRRGPWRFRTHMSFKELTDTVCLPLQALAQ